MNGGVVPPEHAPPKPVVDVVILTWNDGDLLQKAIASALGSESVQVAVCVVDNGSDTPAEIPSDSRVQLVRNDTNRGVAAGRNQGVALGAAPILCLLDSDAELAPQSLVALTEPLTDPTIGAVVPVFQGQTPEASAGGAPTLRVKLERGLNRRLDYEAVPRGRLTQVWDVDFGIGACQVIRREVFEQVGGLDETIFYGPEDVDFCLRAREAGFRVVQVDGAGVIHPARRAFRKPLTRRGLRHAGALALHLWRHRKSGGPAHEAATATRDQTCAR